MIHVPLWVTALGIVGCVVLAWLGANIICGERIFATWWLPIPLFLRWCPAHHHPNWLCGYCYEENRAKS